MARDVHERALSPDDQRRGCSQPQGPLPPPPPLGSSRPKRLVEDDDDDADQLLLPPPPPLGSSRPKRLVEDENDDDRLLLPPPPPLRSPRPKRLVEDDRLEADSPRNNGTPRGHGRSPENVYAPLLPAPPAGSSRPGPVVYRLLESESPPDGRSPNPGGVLGAPPSPRRSASRSNDWEKRRRSPPRRSPSPMRHKRTRRDDDGDAGRGRRSPPRGGR